MESTGRKIRLTNRRVVTKDIRFYTTLVVETDSIELKRAVPQRGTAHIYKTDIEAEG